MFVLGSSIVLKLIVEKHRTGCVVAVVRHVARWDVESIIEEYRGFAEPKARECDVTFITDYKVTSLQGLFAKEKGLASTERRDKQQPPPAVSSESNSPEYAHVGHNQEHHPHLPSRRPRMGRYLLASAFALAIWFTTGFYWHSDSWYWEPLH